MYIAQSTKYKVQSTKCWRLAWYGIIGDDIIKGAISSTKGQHVIRITCCDSRHTYVTGVTVMQLESHIGDDICDWSHKCVTVVWLDERARRPTPIEQQNHLQTLLVSIPTVSLVISMGNNRYITFSCFRVVYMTYTVISMGNTSDWSCNVRLEPQLHDCSSHKFTKEHAHQNSIWSRPFGSDFSFPSHVQLYFHASNIDSSSQQDRISTSNALYYCLGTSSDQPWWINAIGGQTRGTFAIGCCNLTRDD